MSDSITFESALESGVKALTAGDFHAAHDGFEAGWRLEQGGKKKTLQVLALWATALLHAERGNQVGARRVMERALERHSTLDDLHSPLMLPALLEAMLQSWAFIRELKPAPPPKWEPELSPMAAGAFELSVQTSCPYCGEPVEVVAEHRDEPVVRYVEDCPVCCRPWEVTLSQTEGLSLARGDS